MHTAKGMFMKKIIGLVLSLTVIVECSAFSYAESKNTLYVSVNGKPEAEGSLNDPIGNIFEAQSMAREMIKNGAESVVIRILSGRYFFDDTLFLTEEDSGISYIGEDGAVFTEAKELSDNGFKNITDPEILLRFKSDVRPYILEYDLKDINLEINKEYYPCFLTNEETQTPARYPNGGYLTAINASGTSEFDTEIPNAENWAKNEDAVITGSLPNTYFWRSAKIKSASESKLVLDTEIRKNAQYFVERALEELDVPGEYYIDKKSSKLYYYPTDKITNPKITVGNKTVISAKSTSNVNISGITFDMCGGTAIYTEQCTDFNIKGCKFYNIQGTYVLNINGQDCTVSENYAYNCDNTFIKYEGGNLKTLSPGNIIIENNRITNCGNVGRGSIIKSGNSVFGMLTSCGNIVRNNCIQDCMVFTPIVFGGNNYTIEKNELFNVGRLINDGGAIYFGRSNCQYGNKVIGNYVHDLNRELSYCGIYSDDGYGGAYVKNNVIARADQAMIINIGMNNRFEDNLFIDVDSGITGGSMMGRETGASLYTETFTAIYNAPYRDAFKKAYPDMVKSLSREPFFAPYDTYINGNVMIGTTGSKKLLKTRHWHFYNEEFDTSLDELRKKGAVTDNFSSYVGSTLMTGTKIDDLTGYGPSKKNSRGEEMNGTPEGNPYFDYDKEFFVDDDAQNYSLTGKFSFDESSVNEINMDDIGIISKNTPYETDMHVYGTYPYNNSLNVSADNVVFKWTPVKNASEYLITVSKNADMSSPIVERAFYESYSDRCVIEELEDGETYYWTINARGIGKSDSFNLQSETMKFKTADHDYINSVPLEYAVNILNTELDAVKSKEIIYPENIVKLLEEEKVKASLILEKHISKEEFKNEEDKIYSLLVDVKEYRSVNKPEIYKCSVSQTDSAVTLEGRYFQPNTLVSVLVTNPKYELDSVRLDENLSEIQYASIAETSDKGTISFSFDTIVNGSDMPGVYKVYMSDEDGRIYTSSFTYGNIEISDIKYYDNDRPIEAVNECENPILKCVINNRSGKILNPKAVTAFYKNGRLCKAESNNIGTIAPNSTYTAEWQINTSFSETDEVKVIFVDSLTAMKPLSNARIIYENKE